MNLMIISITLLVEVGLGLLLALRRAGTQRVVHNSTPWLLLPYKFDTDYFVRGPKPRAESSVSRRYGGKQKG